MKKIRTLMLIAGTMLACLSCEKKPDHGDRSQTKFVTYYTFVNNSSYTISVESYSIVNTTGESKGNNFTIFKQGLYDIKYQYPDYQYPFKQFYNKATNEKVIVSNGKVIVEQRSYKKDVIFDLERYMRTEENLYDTYVTRYTYTFTDDFFQDGESIE